MNKVNKAVLVCEVLLAAVLLGACSGPPAPSATGCQALRPSVLSVRDRFQQPVNTFSAGEPISFEWSLTNITQQPQTVDNGGCFEADFAVRNRGGDLLWTSSDGVACIQIIQEVRFEPGETRRYSAEWNQRDRNNQPVSAGQYQATAHGPTACREAHLTGAGFVIR